MAGQLPSLLACQVAKERSTGFDDGSPVPAGKASVRVGFFPVDTCANVGQQGRKTPARGLVPRLAARMEGNGQWNKVPWAWQPAVLDGGRGNCRRRSPEQVVRMFQAQAQALKSALRLTWARSRPRQSTTLDVRA